MLQATASLMAGANSEEQGRLLTYLSTRRSGSCPASRIRRPGVNFISRMRNRLCSDSCLKFVYLTCATLVSASFIIGCILLHLIVAPYLSESVFEPGVCKFLGSRRDDTKKCENKCSKERSSFPCLQLWVVFTPLRVSSASNVCCFNTSKMQTIEVLDDQEITSTVDAVVKNHKNLPLGPSWERQGKYDAPPNARYNFNSSESRTVYLYDYFSTFSIHKSSRCSISPCHRREEDNRNAVEEFKRVLWRRHIFLCYARPLRLHYSEKQSTTPVQTPSSSVSADFDHQLPIDAPTLHLTAATGPVVQSSVAIPKDSKDAAAILYRSYTSEMFFHSLCWPGGIFVGGLIILLFTYLADGCDAWARDKTVIA